MRARNGRAAEIRLAHDGGVDDLRRRAVGHELALVQHDDAVGELFHHVHLVLDQQDGLVATPADGGDDVEDGRDLVDAHAGGRLVEHEDVGLERQQDRDLELALVAVRQGRGHGVGALRERHGGEMRARAVGQLAMRRGAAEQVQRLAAPDLNRQAHVLQRGEIGKQVRELEGAAQAKARAARGGEAGDVLAVQLHGARGRGQLPRDQVEIGRLARAVRPHDRGERARPEGTRHAIDGRMAAEPDGELFSLQHLVCTTSQLSTLSATGVKLLGWSARQPAGENDEKPVEACNLGRVFGPDVRRLARLVERHVV